MRRLAAILALTAAPATADVFLFQSPSGNIVCSVGLGRDSADVECGIVERSGPPARPRPADCTESWGHSFLLFDRGETEMRCVPAPRRLDGVETAPYGETARFNDIACVSETTGLTCRNADGRGFFLSRRRQEVF